MSFTSPLFVGACGARVRSLGAVQFIEVEMVGMGLAGNAVSCSRVDGSATG